MKRDASLLAAYLRPASKRIAAIDALLAHDKERIGKKSHGRATRNVTTPVYPPFFRPTVLNGTHIEVNVTQTGVNVTGDFVPSNWTHPGNETTERFTMILEDPPRSYSIISANSPGSTVNSYFNMEGENPVVAVASNDGSLHLIAPDYMISVGSISLASIFDPTCFSSFGDTPIITRFDQKTRRSVIAMINSETLSLNPTRVCIGISSSVSASSWTTWVFDIVDTTIKYTHRFQFAIWDNHYILTWADDHESAVADQKTVAMWINAVEVRNGAVTPGIVTTSLTYGDTNLNGLSIVTPLHASGRGSNGGAVIGSFMQANAPCGVMYYMFTFLSDPGTTTVWQLACSSIDYTNVVPPTFVGIIFNVNQTLHGESPDLLSCSARVGGTDPGCISSTNSRSLSAFPFELQVTYTLVEDRIGFTIPTFNTTTSRFSSLWGEYLFAEFFNNGLPPSNVGIVYAPGNGLNMFASTVQSDCKGRLWLAGRYTNTTYLSAGTSYKNPWDTNSMSELASLSTSPFTDTYESNPMTAITMMYDFIKPGGAIVTQMLSSPASVAWTVQLSAERRIYNVTAVDSCGTVTSCNATLVVKMDFQCDEPPG